MDKVCNFRIPKWDELPSTPLYMDNLLNYVNSELEPSLFPMVFLPLTKNMVNNYVKAHFVEAPVNKKYSRQSIAMIIVIYVLKSCYSNEEVFKLIQFGLSFDDAEYTYNTLMTTLENAVEGIFSGHVELDHNNNDRMYLVQNFALSFASKLYVSKVFLGVGKE